MHVPDGGRPGHVSSRGAPRRAWGHSSGVPQPRPPPVTWTLAQVQLEGSQAADPKQGGAPGGLALWEQRLPGRVAAQEPMTLLLTSAVWTAEQGASSSGPGS